MPNYEFDKYAEEATSKYRYFVLAASAAAIGYSFDKAESSSVSVALAFFAVAILFWALSFYYGCKSIQASLSVSNILANDEHLKNRLEVAAQHLPPAAVSLLREKYNEQLEPNNKILERDSIATGRYLGSQFKFLLRGAIAFVLWQSAELVMDKELILWLVSTLQRL